MISETPEMTQHGKSNSQTPLASGHHTNVVKPLAGVLASDQAILTGLPRHLLLFILNNPDHHTSD